MSDKRIDPRQQFSKWLARWTSVFWVFYMAWVSVICVIQPAAVDAAVYLGLTASAVMLLNVWAYTRNSVYEKAILAGLEKDRLRLTWKGQNSTTDEDLG